MSIGNKQKFSIVLIYRNFLSPRCIFIVALTLLATIIIPLSSVSGENISSQPNSTITQKVVDQNNIKEMLTKGQTQWKNGDLDNALKTLEDVVKLELSNKHATKILKGMQLQKNRLDNLLKNAINSISSNDYKSAEKSLKSASLIQDKYPKYREVSGQLTDAKKKTKEKISTDADLERMASLLISSKRFQEIAAKNYAKALLLLSKDMGKLHLYNIDKALWDTDTSQFGWMTFFNSAIPIFNKNLDGFPIVGYYNPYSDIILLTIWAQDHNNYKIVDAEVIMGSFLNGGEITSTSIPLWLQDKRDYKASLGLSVARTVLAFESTFSSVRYRDWREKLKILHHQDIIKGFNYSAISVMANSHLLNIFNYINPETGNPKLIKVNELVSKIIKQLSVGKIDEETTISKLITPETMKLLKGIPPDWFETIKVSAVIPNSKEYLVFLSPSMQANYSLCISIKTFSKENHQVRIDLIDFQHFYTSFKDRLKRVQLETSNDS